MSGLIYQPDQAAKLVELLRSQDQGQPRILALANGIGAGLQLFEDVNFDLLQSLIFENAAGAQLDIWGAIVGEDRGPLGDADYRRFILARILVNRCTGTPDELIRIYALIANGAAREMQVDGLGLPYYQMQAIAPMLPQPPLRRRIARTMAAVRPAGVASHVLIGSASTAIFGSGPGWGQTTWGRVVI